MQALRRKMTVAELGQLSPLSLKSPPCFFFSQPMAIRAVSPGQTYTQTHKQIHRQHQRHRVSYLLSEDFYCCLNSLDNHLKTLNLNIHNIYG